MEENKFLKYMKIIGFLVLMSYSTWATVESVHRSLDQIPLLIVWLLSIIFFVITAWGVSNMITSFDQTQRIEGRFAKLAVGFLTAATFWVFLILPTNTHTFFYEAVIEQITSKEIDDTRAALQDIQTKGPELIKQDKANFNTKVLALLNNYKTEVLNYGNPGVGKSATTILSKIELELGQEIHLPTMRGSDFRGRNEYLRQVENTIRQDLSLKLQEYDEKATNYLNVSGSNDKNNDKFIAQKLIQDFNTLRNSKLPFKKYSQNAKDKLYKDLSESQLLITRYSDKLKNLTTDKNTAVSLNGTTTKIKELENVLQVWKNYFKGDYKNMGFEYWLILSVLIDIAGFILFHLAFKKNQY